MFDQKKNAGYIDELQFLNPQNKYSSIENQFSISNCQKYAT